MLLLELHISFRLIISLFFYSLAHRWHSANFYELCQRCCGYDAISATLDAYFDPEKFRKLPERPPVRLIERGKIVHLISSVEGILKGFLLVFSFVSIFYVFNTRRVSNFFIMNLIVLVRRSRLYRRDI